MASSQETAVIEERSRSFIAYEILSGREIDKSHHSKQKSPSNTLASLKVWVVVKV